MIRVTRIEEQIGAKKLKKLSLVSSLCGFFVFKIYSVMMCC